MLLLIAFLVGVLSIMAGTAAAAGKEGKSLLPGSSLLLIPDGTNARVMGFDPLTGNLVDPNVIPTDANITNPWFAMISPGGNSILVSDANTNTIQEFDLDGSYIGYFAPAAGPDATILDGPYGMTLRPNGNLLVTCADGANANSVVEFSTAGVYQGNFVANDAGGIVRPWGIVYRAAQSDYLVSGFDSDAIYSYDLGGNFQSVLATIDAEPEQMALAANGNILVAAHGGSQDGVVELTSGGVLVGVYNPPAVGGGYRGVYELPNGNILAANSNGVYEISRAGTLVSTKIDGVSCRNIQFAQVLSKTGFWVVPGQTGGAISIEIQGSHLAIGWGEYNESGLATWLFSDGKMSSATTYSGILYRFGGGSCFDCPYSPPTSQTNEGTISITFTSNTTATLNAFGINKNIQRSVF